MVRPPQGNENRQPVILRSFVESVNIYEVTDLELEKLMEGSPATVQLNFAIGLLSCSLTLIVTLFTVDIASDRTFAVFLCGAIVGVILSIYFFVVSWKKRGSISKVIQGIKERTLSDEDTSDLDIYEIAPFLRKIRDLEAGHKFLSIKWLRETIFAENPEAQEALQICIEKQYLTTYKIDNPRHKSRQVSCCKINQNKREIRKILELEKA